MNKKFSTLMAAFLAVGATFTAEAGVVKVTTPVNGKQYVIGVKDVTLTAGKFSAATQILMSNSGKDGVDVAVATKDATTLDAFTQWFFNSTVANQYRISLEASAKYLATSSATEMTIADAVEGTNVAKDTWVVSSEKLGAAFAGNTTPACTDQITFASAVGSAGTVALSNSGSEISFYAENYDAAEEIMSGMKFNLKNSVAADEYVFIKIGDKFVSIAADGSTVEMVSADALETTEGKFRATFKVSGTTKYQAVAATNQTNGFLKAGTGAGQGLSLDATASATEFFFDNSDTYIGQKGASMYTATGAANYVGADGKTTAIGATTPSQRPEVKIYKSSNLLVAPASSTNPLISAENFISGGKYLLSANGTNFQKVASVAGDVVTLGVTTSASIDEDAMWEVKQTKDASGNYSYTLYNVGQKVYLKLVTGTTTFNSGVEGQGYTGGFILLASDGKALDSASGSAAADLQAVDGTSDQLFGLYDAGFKPYTQAELSALENGAFSMTIAIDKDNVGKKTIKGSDIFDGSLTPVAATANATRVQLKDADGKYIVLTKNAWGSQNSLNGADNKGLKFAKVAEADKDKADYYSWFEINYPLVNGKTYEELIVRVYDAAAGTLQGRLFISEVDKTYYLTVAKTLTAGEVWAYAQTGGSTLVNLKTFLQKGKFYTVAQVDADYQIVKVLGTTLAGNADFLDKGAVQMDQPEGQWAASVDANGKLVLTNRESLKAYDKLGILYGTDKDNVYKNGDKLYLINIVEKHAATDGYEAWTNNQLRDEQYTLGFYSNVLGAAAYMSENHANKHLIGLEKDIKNATAWDVKAFDAKRTATAQTDSVYVVSNLYFWNKDKKGGADWDVVADTLKTVSYKFINASNGEPVKFSTEENAYVCDKDKDVDNAPRFAIKKMADGKYNVVAVKANEAGVAADKYYTLAGNKLYGGFSVAQGNVNATGMYNKSENDLAVIEKTAAPEYVKLNMSDTIRIFREGADASILFEKGEFLGLENIHEYTKMTPAMYVDTAYYNRGTNNRWQYLLGVNIDRKVVNDDCGIPSHEKFHADTTYGRFLVNLVDSAELYKKTHLHDNKYVNTEGFAKLGFVKGFHINDTLVIQREGVLIPAKADSIYMGSKDFNVAKFAFRIVDHETNAFKIETLYKKFSDGPAAKADKLGYLKWMNGFVVVVNAIENGDTFNLEADHSAPTANEGINASEVSVIAKEGAVVINGAAGKTVTISNVLGQTIANTVLSSDNATISAPAGIVVVAVEGEAAVKAIVK